MPFEFGEIEFTDEDLCSIEIEAPSQLVQPNQFDVLAAAYFGTLTDEVKTKDGPCRITFGISAAKLVVETCDNSRIKIEGRYEKSAYTMSYSQKSNEDSSTTTEAGGAAGFQTPSALKWFEARAKAGGDYSKAVTVNAIGEAQYEKTFMRVWPAGIRHWRFLALNPPGEDPVLQSNELEDQPLCTVESPKGIAEVTASIVISFGDLWLDINKRDDRAESLEDAANRNAVAKAVYARRMDKRNNRADPLNPDSEVILARAKLVRLADEK